MKLIFQKFPRIYSDDTRDNYLWMTPGALNASLGLERFLKAWFYPQRSQRPERGEEGQDLGQSTRLVGRCQRHGLQAALQHVLLQRAIVVSRQRRVSAQRQGLGHRMYHRLHHQRRLRL